jgi:hypothetical protein
MGGLLMIQPETARNGTAACRLTPRQDAVAVVLAAGASFREAAHQTGAGERTIKTWTATHPQFVRRVTELRAEMTSRALGRLVEGMASAADTLRKLLTAKSEMVRLGAARSVIELGTRVREILELEERITALEQRAPRRAG